MKSQYYFFTNKQTLLIGNYSQRTKWHIINLNYKSKKRISLPLHVIIFCLIKKKRWWLWYRNGCDWWRHSDEFFSCSILRKANRGLVCAAQLLIKLQKLHCFELASDMNVQKRSQCCCRNEIGRLRFSFKYTYSEIKSVRREKV